MRRRRLVVRRRRPAATVRHLVELDLHNLPLAVAATQLVAVHTAAAAAVFRRLLDRAVVAIFGAQLALAALDTLLTHPGQLRSLVPVHNSYSFSHSLNRQSCGPVRVGVAAARLGDGISVVRRFVRDTVVVSGEASGHHPWLLCGAASKS
uniref:(northern house mosquito) hypothetical protein n=1 Tax=Culex pipiens TaxID=7175 RepID=A0A8D8CSI8_CULPI